LACGRTSEAIEIGDGEASMLGLSRQRVNNARGSSLRNFGRLASMIPACPFSISKVGAYEA
jgi:hypothetical protein